MKQFISAISLVVPDYDQAIDFYVGKLGFELVEDSQLSPSKRWVTVAPPGSEETKLLLAKADGETQMASMGNQAGGRVFLFLTTDNLARDYAQYQALGIKFLETPRHEAYGSVVVFEDPFGNKWDLIEPKP